MNVLLTAPGSPRYDVSFYKNGVRFDGGTFSSGVTSDPVDALPTDVFTVGIAGVDLQSAPLSVTVAGTYRTGYDGTSWGESWRKIA